LDSKDWWPCKQVLEDKADSTEMIITTQSTNKVGSSGLLVSSTILPGNKIKNIWKSKYPIAYYLISFAVGPYAEYDQYAHIDGLSDSVFIQSYLISNSSYLNQHKAAIEKTKLCMNLFSHLFGYFPFREEKYGYCVTPWPLGAMENQTMTTIGSAGLDTTAINYSGYNYFYTAHELAHSWFGDYVTCGSGNDVWLNEGFASYCEYIALQSIYSQNIADKWINEAKSTTMKVPGGSIYYDGSLLGNDDYRLAYKKGALLLHMLRYEIGNDSVFYDILKSYLIKYANKTALGLDFKAVLEEKTGRDFTDFFNQWYFGEGYPIFNIQCNQSNDSLYITSIQTKSISTALLFKMHFMLLLKYAGGDTTLMLFQSQPTENFIIPFSRNITTIVFDPGNWLLAKSTVKVTAIEDNPQADLKSFRLSQNYPNPFNPETIIQYSIPERSYVNLKLYDVLGREIATLVNEVKSSGDYSVKFNCKNIANGVYIYRLQAGNYDISRKLIILK
jgi:aminopeptidase N